MSGAASIWHRSPIMILALAQAAIAMVVAFGFHVSGEQMAAIMAFVQIGVAVLTNSQIYTITGAANALDLAAQAAKVTTDQAATVEKEV